MKKLFGFTGVAAVLASTAILAVSCGDKPQPDPVVITYDIYTAGNEYDESSSTTPVIYLGTDEQYRLEKGYTLTGLALSGTSLYACGYDATAVKPVIWKDGKMSNIAVLGQGKFYDMVAGGNSVYCCGYIEDEGVKYGVIYKDGDEFYRYDKASEFKVMDLGPTGDIYLIKTFGTDIELVRVNATTAGVTERRLISSDVNFVPTDIYVGNQDICVSLNGHVGGQNVAYCWLSRESSPFAMCDTESTACSAAIYGGSFFIGGSIKADGQVHFATQWIGMYAQNFTYGCNPGGSYVKLLKPEEFGLFEAVQSPGQVQVCCDGNIIQVFECNESFDVTAWDIIRVQ